MTAISSTTSPAGSWSSTAAAAFPIKATIQLGWSRSRSGSSRRAARKRLAREREWISASPRARQAKSKARYQRYEDLVQQAAEKTAQSAQIIIPVVERLGQNVIEFEGLRKGYGNNLLIDDLT